MMANQLKAIGIVEINFYVNSVIVLDAMLKTADVDLVSCEKKLGGRMVTMIISGSTSSVKAAIEEAKKMGRHVIGEKNVKVAVCISNPHEEIIKVLNLLNKVS